MCQQMLTNEQEEMVLSNQKMVRAVINKRFLKGKQVNFYEMEDLISIGNIGLIKAVKTYDESKGMFSSYAYPCILNELKTETRYAMKQETRKKERGISEQSMDRVDNKGKTLSEKIVDVRQNFLKEMEERDTIRETINILLNCIHSQKRIMFLYYLSGQTEQKIANFMGFTRQYCSLVMIKVCKKIKKYFESDATFQEFFHVAMPNQETMQIILFKKNFGYFEEIVEVLHRPFFQTLKKLQIKTEAEQIVIQFILCAEAFEELAHFFKLLDVEEDLLFKTRETNLVDNSDPVQLSKAQKAQKVQELKTIIFEKKFFTRRELLEHFSISDVPFVDRCLKEFRNLGIIVRKTRGYYEVRR